MNMLDYLDWRGDVPFTAMPLNEVDNLIFSTLVYLKMDGMIPPEGITIAGLYDRCTAQEVAPTGLANDPLPLLKKAAVCERFRAVRVSGFVNTVDTDRQIQFAAATFAYAPGEMYIAFRGTDNTIVGWREDLNFSFLPVTPGQEQAAEYVSRAAAAAQGSITVGGHSKGGNFAVYGAAFCDPAARDRITRVYSNDGPGFNRSIVNSPEYAAVLDRILKIIPESSLVGILLSSRAERKVIRSSAKGTAQHDPYSWCVMGAAFEEADARSTSGILLDDTLNNWADALSDDDLRIFVNTIFDVLEASGVETIKEINQNKRMTYNAILKAIGQVDAESKSEFMELIRRLLLSGKDAVVSETKKNFSKHRETNP